MCLAHTTGLQVPSVSTACQKRHLVVARVLAERPAHEGQERPSVKPSGLQYLSPEAQERARTSKAKYEKVKVEKCGSTMWTDAPELARLIREGETKWEELNLDDLDIRMKWAGLFHRGKRTPGKFMMRLRVPNGELTSAQLRYLASVIQPYGADGCADITTRAGIQLRGVVLTDVDAIMHGLEVAGLSSLQSGMDNVRNLTGSPIAGVDPHELVDTRPICRELDNLITDYHRGNAQLTNLPRKVNICVSSSRDDFPHTQINDVGFEAVHDPATGEVVFNLNVGGYLSTKRNVMAITAPISLTRQQLAPFTKALLEVFRDHGPRADRSQTRLLWLVEALGMERWVALVEAAMGPGTQLRPRVEERHSEPWPRRDVLGVHDQKQPGLCWVGACVPAGRMQAGDFDQMARIAETYGDSTLRVTVDENIVFVNIPKDKVDAMLAEPLFQKFKVNPGLLMRGMVSCTGSQFCGFALAETKNRAIALMEQMESELDLPRAVRINVTGCSNSCGQAQVGEIGLMGAPAKRDGKAVEGFKIMVGGRIGEDPALATDFAQGVPADELAGELRKILIEQFGATPKKAAAV